MSIHLNSPEFDPTDPRRDPAEELYEDLGYIKALLAVNYGHPSLDCDAIGDRAFAEVLADESLKPRQWRSELPKRAFSLAEEALRDPGPPRWHATDDLFGLIFDDETRAAFRAADRLPRDMGRVYQASRVFGMSDEKIASLFKISENCVRAHCSKAKQRLDSQPVDMSRLTRIHGTADSIVEPTGDASASMPDETQESHDEH